MVFLQNNKVLRGFLCFPRISCDPTWKIQTSQLTLILSRINDGNNCVFLIDLSPDGAFQGQTNKLESLYDKHSVQNTQLAGGRQICYIKGAAKELILGQLRTNPVRSRVEGLTTEEYPCLVL